MPPATLVYRYHTRVNWCSNGSTITSTSSNYGYFTNINAIYRINNENRINQISGSGYSRLVHTQGDISVCIAYKVGCYANFYPWGKVTIKANGTNTFSWGE